MARREYVGNAPATTLSGNISSGATSITVTSGGGANYPTGAVGNFYIVIDRGLGAEEKILCSARSGDVFTAAGRGGIYGDGTSAASHVSGAVVEHVFTKTDADEANDHINTTANDHHTQYLNTARHDITARHAYGAALGTRPVPGSSAVGDVAAAGSSAVPSAGDHVHGREAFSFPTLSSALVATSESTASSVFVDLVTSGPAVTLTTGTSVLLCLSTYMSIGQNLGAAMGFAVSGATTLAATLTTSVSIRTANITSESFDFRGSRVVVVTGLTPGSNTFTAKFASYLGGGSATFQDRQLWVMRLN